MSLFGRPPELLGDFNNAKANAKATFSIPRTHTYYQLMIEADMVLADGTTPIVLTASNIGTYIKSIRLKINANTTYELLGEQAKFYWDTRGITMTNNNVPVYLTLPTMRMPQGEDVSGYGTANVQDFDIEVQFEAGTFLINKLQLQAIRGINSDLGPHMSITNFTRNATGAGRVNLVGYTDPQQSIHAIYMDTTVITSVRMTANSDQAYETATAAARQAWSKMYKRDQAGGTVVELNTTNRVADMFEVAGRDVRMTVEATGADTWNVMVEGMKVINGLPASRSIA